MPWGFLRRSRSSRASREASQQAPSVHGSASLASQPGDFTAGWQQVEHLHLPPELHLQPSDLQWPRVSASQSDHSSRQHGGSGPAGDSRLYGHANGMQRDALAQLLEADELLSDDLLSAAVAEALAARPLRSHRSSLSDSEPDTITPVDRSHTAASTDLHQELDTATSPRNSRTERGSSPLLPSVNPLLAMPLQPLPEGTEGSGSESDSPDSSMGVACSTASDDSCIPPAAVRSLPVEPSTLDLLSQPIRYARSEGGHSPLSSSARQLHGPFSHNQPRTSRSASAHGLSLGQEVDNIQTPAEWQASREQLRAVEPRQSQRLPPRPPKHKRSIQSNRLSTAIARRQQGDGNLQPVPAQFHVQLHQQPRPGWAGAQVHTAEPTPVISTLRPEPARPQQSHSGGASQAWQDAAWALGTTRLQDTPSSSTIGQQADEPGMVSKQLLTGICFTSTTGAPYDGLPVLPLQLISFILQIPAYRAFHGKLCFQFIMP